MFYATRTYYDGVQEQHLLKFYSKADRAAYLAKDDTAEVITAAQARKLQFAGASYTISDKQIGAVYFARIVI